ncbi:MAG: exodeoxyribonuclease VII small subunit [Deltaproteobacteria bacterium]|nr:exodeoxyribonuclease VII small subunit [Deltaproteobacteria bacterium]
MPKKESKEINFEMALAQLEEIVKKMEQGNLTLDQSLKLFEEGSKLGQFCEKALQEAQGKIEILVKDQNGNKTRVAFLSE